MLDVCTYLAGSQRILQVPKGNIRLFIIFTSSDEASCGRRTPSQCAASYASRRIAESQCRSLSTKIPNDSNSVVAYSSENLLI